MGRVGVRVGTIGVSNGLSMVTSQKSHKDYKDDKDYGANQIIIGGRVCACGGIAVYLSRNGGCYILIDLIKNVSALHRFSPLIMG